MLPRHLTDALKRAWADYPENTVPFTPFLEGLDTTFIVRVQTNYVWGLLGRPFYAPVEDEDGSLGRMSTERTRHDADALLRLTRAAQAELRRAWGKLCDEHKRRKIDPPKPPERWTEARDVWRASEAILRDYAEENRSTQDTDTEAA